MSARWLLGFGVPLLVLLVACIWITRTIGWRPFLGPKRRPLTARTFQRTPERLERGAYLAESVALCIMCHSPVDWTKPDAPYDPGRKGAGGGFPMAGIRDKTLAPNITPDLETGIGSWTDDQISRAIREGIGHRDELLDPMMPYPFYHSMSDEDVASIVVYLRSLTPVRNAVATGEIPFPDRYLFRIYPEPILASVPEPDKSRPEELGKYLAGLANCVDCHTAQEDIGGPALAGMEYAGGQVLDGPWGKVASSNITPDATGISYYTPEMFIQTMRTGVVRSGQLNSVMPWHAFRGMTNEDLKSIFAFLQKQRPVHHRVNNTEKPTKCRVCKGTHGLGAAN